MEKFLLVMLVFERGFSQIVQNVLRYFEQLFSFIEVIPNGVSFRWAVVISYDFCDDSFPPVRSAVNANDWWREVESSARSFVRFKSDLSFEAAPSTNDGTIIGLYEERVIAVARHIIVIFLSESFLNRSGNVERNSEQNRDGRSGC